MSQKPGGSPSRPHTIEAPGTEREHIRSVRQALARIPAFPPDSIKTARITRLRGLTNRVYAVDTGEAQFCLRIPGPGTAAIIDRRAEEANARRAAEAGVAPTVLHFGDDGVMLTPLIADAVPLSAQAFRDRPGAVARAAVALRHLHQRSADFVSVFRSFDTVARYARLLAERGAGVQHLADAIAESTKVGDALARRPAVPKACHCDPTGANLLDTGERVWLIDWEYSGMNDPMWDLAYLSLQSAFDDGLDEQLITAYLGRRPHPAETGRMAAQKAACELLSAAWALVQDSSGNRVADFRSYAEVTLAAFRERIDSDDFAAHLTALRAG